MGLSHFHDSYIRPEILKRWRPVVVEIGVEHGGHTRQLLTSCLLRLGKVFGIDPGLPRRARMFLRAYPFTELIEEPSLEALPELARRRVVPDIVLVDGDHNYFTVSQELRAIDKLLSRQGVLILHDVGWPYGRRDGYYEPERIPGAARQPFARRGMVPGERDLASDGGLNPGMCNALREGGPRNGVLTAIEDFVAENPAEWHLEIVAEEHGLAILRRRV